MRERIVIAILAGCVAGGCMPRFRSKGGGEIGRAPERVIDPRDVALLPQYRVEAVVRGLTFPTGVAFDDEGQPHLVEAGYSYGEVFTTPRLLRVEPDGRTEVVAEGDDNGPWNGLAFADGAFFVSEGGVREGGRVLRIGRDGAVRTLVEGLPSQGDHHTNGPVVRDGWVYFGQGTATNAGVVGEDNLQMGWLARSPRSHDVPCRDVTLTGRNYVTDDPLTPDPDDRATTGAFVPFGTPTRAGQVVPGRVPCSGAVMRVPVEGGPVELVAWGFRNPYGLAFSPDGRLFVTDNGFDRRGSRPVFGAADMLWEVLPGQWYGWPDFAEGRPVWQRRYGQATAQPQRLLAAHPGPPPRPAAYLGVHSSSDGLDFSRNPRFGFVGNAFIAQFGDQAPMVGNVSAPVGFKIVRVDPSSGVISDFAVNHGDQNGPASKLGRGGLERPIAVRFDPTGTALYVVDFGVLVMSERGARPQPGSGVLWRITRREAAP